MYISVNCKKFIHPELNDLMAYLSVIFLPTLLVHLWHVTTVIYDDRQEDTLWLKLVYIHNDSIQCLS